MHRRPLLLAAPALFAGLVAGPGRAATPPPQPRAVLELFTSQSCSSCPPADALLREVIAREPAVLALSWHVTYWNRLGWRDPLSLDGATERQRRYAETLRLSTVYTPQAVIQGRTDAVGSNRGAVAAALARALARPPATTLALQASPERVVVAAGAGAGRGQLLVLGFDALHVTRIGGGENGGRTLSHAHVVRSVVPLGTWDGTPRILETARGAGEQVAALLQAEDGAILAAAVG